MLFLFNPLNFELSTILKIWRDTGRFRLTNSSCVENNTEVKKEPRALLFERSFKKFEQINNKNKKINKNEFRLNNNVVVRVLRLLSSQNFELLFSQNFRKIIIEAPVNYNE